MAPLMIRTVVIFSFFSCIAAAQSCTNASYVGTHFYTLEGTVLSSGTYIPDKQLGRLISDGDGNLTGTATESLNGVINRYNLAGTYTVNPDCSGTSTLNVTPQGGSTGSPSVSSASFQLINGGRQGLIAIATSGAAMAGQEYTAATQCSVGQIAGPYGFLGAGASGGATPPYTTVGVATVDGRGAFSSYNLTLNNNGSVRLSGTGTYTIASDCTGAASLGGGAAANMTLAVTASGTILGLQTDPGSVFLATLQPVSAPSVLSQFAFGGGWYSALYFSNTANDDRSFKVSFFADDGTPLTVPGAGTSTVLTLHGLSSAIIEAPNAGNLSQGYVTVSLPPGVVGYGVVRQTVPNIADQEAVVPLSSASSTKVTLAWDETKYTTAVAIVNPSAVAAKVAVTVTDSTGRSLGTGTVQLAPNTKTAAVLKSLLPNTAAMDGLRGFATFSVTAGNVSVLGLRFNGSAFTSIPTTSN